MTVHYEVDESAALIRTSCVGDVTLDQVLDHFRELEADPIRPARLLNVLLDLSDCASTPEPDQLRAVSGQIALVEESLRFGACAIVAPRDVVFGLARMFEVFAGDHFQSTHVCRSRAEAEEWLRSQRSPRS